MFDKVVERVIKNAEEVAKDSIKKGDFIKDGIWHCGECKTPKEIEITIFGQQRKIPCDCECMAAQFAKEQDKLKATQKSEQRQRDRSIGIRSKELFTWTFENSKNNNAAINVAKKYVSKWKQMYQDNIGLMFYGDPGTGKTYASMCIANALIDMGVSVLATNFSRIIADLSNFKNDKNEYIDDLNTYSLLIIDDLGGERNTETATQYVEDVIDSRIRANKPLIITTNLSVDSMKQCTDLGKQRIYSRVLGATLPVKVTGNDMRLEQQKDKLKAARAMFEVSE